MIANLNALDRDAFVQILTQPKNAIVKQYTELFKMDKVELVFEPAALEAIADRAIQLGTGARGLRSIVEDVLALPMYEVPSDHTISKVTVTADCVRNGGLPKIEYDASRTPQVIKIPAGALGKHSQRSEPSTAI